MFVEIPDIFTKELRTKIISQGRKSSEDEVFQKKYFESSLNIKVEKKKDIRVNTDSGVIKIVKSVMKEVDPSLWTEDFDGFATVNNKRCAISFKMIPESGGAQNRSIIAVYKHIKACIKSLSVDNNYQYDKFLFILDGEELSDHWVRMNNLVPVQLKEKFYIGSLKGVINNV